MKGNTAPSPAISHKNSKHAMSTSRLRILHLIPHDAVGGVEIAARSMAERVDLPCDFTLQLIAGESRLTDKHSVIESRYRSSNNPLAHLAALRRVLHERPQVLICSLWRTAPVGVLVKLLRPHTKLIYFLHNDSSAHLADAGLSEFMMLVSDAIWADSSATLEARARRRHAASRRVISFVTVRRQAPEQEQKMPAPRFVSWCRLSRAKGIDRALHFVARVATFRPDVTFEIWGPDNGEQSYLEQLTGELGIQKNVQFKGLAQASELPAIARRHSFYLQLSRREGMAMSVVEGMQLGLVPIVTRIGEMQHYCREGHTGLVFDPEHPDKTVARVRELLDDPGEYQRIRATALDHWAAAPLYADEVCQTAQTT